MMIIITIVNVIVIIIRTQRLHPWPLCLDTYCRHIAGTDLALQADGVSNGAPNGLSTLRSHTLRHAHGTDTAWLRTAGKAPS